VIPAVLVLGTDTDVGKTAFIGALALAWRHSGQVTTLRKPFAAGSWADTDILRTLGQIEEPRELVTPYFTDQPLVPAPPWRQWTPPEVTARVRETIESAAPENTVLLMEGIGGVRSPLSLSTDFLQVAAALRLPTVLVTACTIGTVSRTLVSLGAARAEGVAVVGLVLNRFDDHDTVCVHSTEVLRGNALCPAVVVTLPALPEATSARVVSAGASYLIARDDDPAEALRVAVGLPDLRPS